MAETRGRRFRAGGVVLAVVTGAISAPLWAAPTAYLPPSGSVMGWKMVGRPATYDGNTLYQLVDGDADAFKQYAFRDMVDARYSPNGRPNPSIDVNIYDMSDPLDAFGKFSEDRLGAQPVNLGAGGTRTTDGTGISFWKGRYLVRIATTSRTAPFMNAMLALARAIAARLPGSSALPAFLKSLPPGQMPQSERYVRSNVEAHAFLSNAILARYPRLGTTAEAFVAQYPSAAAAKSAYSQYQAFERRGRSMAPLKGANGFSVLDTFQRNVVVSQKGNYVVGVVKATNMPAAQALVRQILARLR